MRIVVDSVLVDSGIKGPVGQPTAGNFSPSAEKSPAFVLIVDDEALIRWSLAETLADHGYSVLEAENGKAAIALLTHPDNEVTVVLLDYRLPDLTGLQVLAAIRAVSPQIRVVMMTAYGTPEVVAEAMKLGAVCIVNKPIEMSDVAGLVRRARDAAPAIGPPTAS